MVNETELALQAMEDADRVLGEQCHREIRTLFLQGWIAGYGRGAAAGIEQTGDQIVKKVSQMLEERRSR